MHPPTNTSFLVELFDAFHFIQIDHNECRHLYINSVDRTCFSRHQICAQQRKNTTNFIISTEIKRFKRTENNIHQMHYSLNKSANSRSYYYRSVVATDNFWIVFVLHVKLLDCNFEGVFNVVAMLHSCVCKLRINCPRLWN